MYREVTMIEVREVLRLRGAGLPKKRIAAQLGLDPKTVRRYLEAAATAGVPVTASISDEAVREVLLALHPAGGRPRGDGWVRCVEQRGAIARWCAATASGSPRFASCWGGRASTSRIRRCTGLRSSTCNSGRPRRRSPCSMASRGRSCSSIRGGSAGSRCRRGRSGGFVRGSSPPSARGTASSTPPR